MSGNSGAIELELDAPQYLFSTPAAHRLVLLLVVDSEPDGVGVPTVNSKYWWPDGLILTHVLGPLVAM